PFARSFAVAGSSRAGLPRVHGLAGTGANRGRCPYRFEQRNLGTRKALRHLFAGWHEPVEALIAATEESNILKNGAYDLAPLKRWGRGRVMLLGAAAHPCTPNLGLGG